MKRDFQAENSELGGKVFLPVGNFTVVGNLDYAQATGLAFSPAALPEPTDVLNAGGEVWFHFTGREKNVSPFVTGGIARSAFLGQPDATQAVTGFGISFKRGNTYVIPHLNFSTSDLEDGRTVLGQKYNVKTYIHIPLNDTFNFNVTPEVGMIRDPAIEAYTFQAKVSLGFSFKR